MTAATIDYYSGTQVPPQPNAFTEYLRLDPSGRVFDTQYNVVTRDEAQYGSNGGYGLGEDGDLNGPYAARSDTYVPPGLMQPGSVYSQPPERRAPPSIFGGLFGDQRYYEQQEYSRQRQRRVDPDYFPNSRYLN